MKSILAVLALVALVCGTLTGCQTNGTGPDGQPLPQLTLADYAPLIEAFVQAVDAYADEKLGLPDTPETRLLLATKSIAVQAALLTLKREGFTESQVLAYLKERDADKAKVAQEAADAGAAAMAAVEPAPEVAPATRPQ